MTPQTRLLAEYQCTRLQSLYCAMADRGDVDGFVSLFTDDASITVPEYPPFVGHEAIRASMMALSASGITFRHCMTNSLIEIDSADKASGSCYLIVFNSIAPADADGWQPMELPSTVGQYTDEFVAVSDEWKFKSRVLTRVFRRADEPMRAAAHKKAK